MVKIGAAEEIGVIRGVEGAGGSAGGGGRVFSVQVKRANETR